MQTLGMSQTEVEQTARRKVHEAADLLLYELTKISPHLLSEVIQVGGVEGLSRMLDAVVDTPRSGLTPLERARTRGVKERTALVERAGGLLPLREVADMLGISEEGVRARVRRGKLLSVRHGGEFRYPACQFDEGGEVLRGIPLFLEQFDTSVSDWGKLITLVSERRDPRFNGSPAIELIRLGKVDAARSIAATALGGGRSEASSQPGESPDSTGG